ncbi:MAG TPA: acyltransferase [Polyangiaceae bacterium]|nr:acyltransferase [Polyangiaceae bacterium]
MQSEAISEATKLLRLMLSNRGAALDRIRRGVGIVRAHALFRHAELGRRVNATGYLRVLAAGRISLGDHVQFAGGMIPSQVMCHHGAELVIDEWCGFNYGVVIDCQHAIRIGKRCMFGSMTTLRDSDPRRSGAIVIEDDVWVAHGVYIEPGVRIGAGSVVSAGSVVTADVAPDSLVIGNPAESYPLGGPQPLIGGEGLGTDTLAETLAAIRAPRANPAGDGAAHEVDIAAAG